MLVSSLHNNGLLHIIIIIITYVYVINYNNKSSSTCFDLHRSFLVGKPEGKETIWETQA